VLRDRRILGLPVLLQQPQAFCAAIQIKLPRSEMKEEQHGCTFELAGGPAEMPHWPRLNSPAVEEQLDWCASAIGWRPNVCGRFICFISHTHAFAGDVGFIAR
jgi:hypothetical protein